MILHLLLSAKVDSAPFLCDSDTTKRDKSGHKSRREGGGRKLLQKSISKGHKKPTSKSRDPPRASSEGSFFRSSIRRFFLLLDPSFPGLLLPPTMSSEVDSTRESDPLYPAAGGAAEAATPPGGNVLFRSEPMAR